MCASETQSLFCLQGLKGFPGVPGRAGLAGLPVSAILLVLYYGLIQKFTDLFYGSY